MNMGSLDIFLTVAALVAGVMLLTGHGDVFMKGGNASERKKLYDEKKVQKATGIAGYTLINNSYGFQIVTHTPFLGVAELYNSTTGSATLKRVIDRDLPRRNIADTTIGMELKRQIDDLKFLLQNDDN